MDLSLGTSALRRKLVGCYMARRPISRAASKRDNAKSPPTETKPQDRNSRIAAIEMTDVI